MGRRSRKRGVRPEGAGSGGDVRPEATPPTPARSDRTATLQRARSRSEARNAEARARLEPLAPGERPPAVTVAAVVAVALAIGNVVLWAAGVEVKGQNTSAFGVIVFAGLMLVAAVGLWRARYWAVLGFEALLALTILIAALSLTVASNVAAVLLCVGIIVAATPLFWKLVRAMARIQMPDRRPAGRDG